MEKVVTKVKTWTYRLYKIGYWLIPVAVLAIVFSRIDIIEFKQNIVHTNFWLFALGISLFPIIIMIGAFRWRVIVHSYLGHRLSRWFVLQHYWIGLALGIFVPASLGWDAYRVAVVGKRFGKYVLNIAGIIVEKMMAFVTMAIMILVLYPFVNKFLIRSVDAVNHLIEIAFVLTIVFVILLSVIFFAFRNRATLAALKRAEDFIGQSMEKLGRKVWVKTKAEKLRLPLREIFNPIRRINYFLPILLYSFGIQVVSAVKNQIFFCALGYDLPISINFFLVPIFFFIFILPISFGSLGIREGVYIFFYGLFGVPPEIALSVSFFNLSGILLNIAIGGIIIFVNNISKSSRGAP